jgi:hypothetical protein
VRGLFISHLEISSQVMLSVPDELSRDAMSPTPQQLCLSQTETTVAKLDAGKHRKHRHFTLIFT